MIRRHDLVLTPRALYGLAAAFTLAGLALRLSPPRLPKVDPAPAALAAVQSSRAGIAPASVRAYDPIPAANVFSRSRSAPTVRFVPEGQERQDSVAAPPPKPRPPVFRLFGITVGADGAIALIDADPKVPGAELYRVGDRVGGSPITEITDSTVVIGRPGKPLVLKLRSAETPRR